MIKGDVNEMGTNTDPCDELSGEGYDHTFVLELHCPQKPVSCQKQWAQFPGWHTTAFITAYGTGCEIIQALCHHHLLE